MLVDGLSLHAGYFPLAPCRLILISLLCACLSWMIAYAVQHLGSLAGWLHLASVLRVGSLPQQQHHCLGTFW